VSDLIDTRGVLVALGADQNDYDRVTPLDRLLTGCATVRPLSFTRYHRRQAQ
jgi:hypothetical protein